MSSVANCNNSYCKIMDKFKLPFDEKVDSVFMNFVCIHEISFFGRK